MSFPSAPSGQPITPGSPDIQLYSQHPPPCAIRIRFRTHLEVGQGGVELDTPVDKSVGAVKQPLLVQLVEVFPNGFVASLRKHLREIISMTHACNIPFPGETDLVKRKRRPVPISRNTDPLELGRDLVLVDLLPIPDLLQELFSAVIVSALALGL